MKGIVNNTEEVLNGRQREYHYPEELADHACMDMATAERAFEINKKYFGPDIIGQIGRKSEDLAKDTFGW